MCEEMSNNQLQLVFELLAQLIETKATTVEEAAEIIRNIAKV